MGHHGAVHSFTFNSPWYYLSPSQKVYPNIAQSLCKSRHKIILAGGCGPIPRSSWSQCQFCCWLQWIAGQNMQNPGIWEMTTTQKNTEFKLTHPKYNFYTIFITTAWVSTPTLCCVSVTLQHWCTWNQLFQEGRSVEKSFHCSYSADPFLQMQATPNKIQTTVCPQQWSRKTAWEVWKRVKVEIAAMQHSEPKGFAWK